MALSDEAPANLGLQFTTWQRALRRNQSGHPRRAPLVTITAIAEARDCPRVVRTKHVVLPVDGKASRLVMGAALLGSLLGGLPTLHAEPHRAVVPATGQPDEWKVLTGGMVQLQLPLAPQIAVPAGSFSMGSNAMDVMHAMNLCVREPLPSRCRESQFANESPRHTRQVRGFWMDRSEVSYRDYQRCVRRGGCAPSPYHLGANRFAADALPAVLVDWQGARDYCRQQGARLPTEAEWEFAARGVSGRRYPWGEIFNRWVSNHGRLGELATDATDGYAELAPVDSYPEGRTPLGLVNLAGNVSEWVEDVFHPYSSKPASGSSRATQQGRALRVARGGDYQTAAPWLRSAARRPLRASMRAPWLGFRCVRDLEAGPRRP